MEDSGGVAKVVSLPTRHCTPAPPISDLSEKVCRLLADAEPVAEPPGHAALNEPRIQAPDPSHRNAAQCPQCDRVTWRSTPQCIHCGFDLEGYIRRAAQDLVLAAAVRRHKRHILWTIVAGVAGLTVISLSSLLPVSVGFPIATLVMVAFIVLAFCFRQ
jgi:hypothetical protein